MGKLQALNEARAAGDSLNFWGNNQPKCPHCGADYSIEDHEAWRMYEEGEHDAECGSCNAPFLVSTRVSYSFDTDTQELD